MKRLIALAFLCIPLLGAQSTVTGSFNYNFVSNTICTTTLKANCYDHFEVGIVNNGTFTSSASVPIPTNIPGQVNNIAYTFTQSTAITLPTIIGARIVVRDAAGNLQTSISTTVTVTSATTQIASPSGLTVVIVIQQ